MQTNWYGAPPHLRSILRGIWTIEATPEEEISAKVLPDGTPYLVFRTEDSTLSSTDNNNEEWDLCSFSGPRCSSFDVRIGPSSRIFIVQLAPGGGFSTLGIPMSEFVDKRFDLEAVADKSLRVRDLYERLMGCTQANHQLSLLQHWIGQRSLSNPKRPVDEVVDAITQSNGQREVSDLASSSGYSRRHLTRMMNEHVGHSPKTLSRIMRFDRAIQLGRTRPKLALIDIAMASGYADQAHMTREFSKLGGIRPSDLHGDAGALIW